MCLVNFVSLSALDNTCVDFVYVVTWGMATSGNSASRVRSMECLSWRCRGTSVSEEKISSYSSTTFSISYYRVGEPCFEVVATILFFPCGWIVMKKNFLVWETILLHCFAVVKEMIGGGTTSGILYNLVPREIIIVWGLDSYTTCHFHKYGWPNNTSDTSRGATWHSTSSMNGLMLYERWHCW